MRLSFLELFFLDHSINLIYHYALRKKTQTSQNRYTQTQKTPA